MQTAFYAATTEDYRLKLPEHQWLIGMDHDTGELCVYFGSTLVARLQYHDSRRLANMVLECADKESSVKKAG